jgi:murein DD-endopeptidase MepM/ murein hydrolase activator NlpD
MPKRVVAIGHKESVKPKYSYLLGNQKPENTVVLEELRAENGAYLGLQGVGSFSYRRGGRGHQMLSGCFFLGQRDGFEAKEPAPGSSYEARPFDRRFKDVTKDFLIPFDRPVVVGIPSGTQTLSLSAVADSYEHLISNQFGVKITLPNKKKAIPSKKKLLSIKKGVQKLVEEDPAQSFEQKEDNRFFTEPAPVATEVLVSLFTKDGRHDATPQWRGWYDSGYLPEWSRFGSKRGRKDHYFHRGWDIFAPIGSTVVATVFPSYLWFKKDFEKLGDTAILNFIWKGKRYSLAYAHLNRLIGQPGQINGLVDIGVAGCTGNASCNGQVPNGGIKDHVHLHLWEVALPRTRVPVNPKAVFEKWDPWDDDKPGGLRRGNRKR